MTPAQAQYLAARQFLLAVEEIDDIATWVDAADQLGSAESALFLEVRSLLEFELNVPAAELDALFDVPGMSDAQRLKLVEHCLNFC